MNGIVGVPDGPLLIVSELFDVIRCGTITLSVPLRDDVIQMGVRDSPDRGLLRVNKGHHTATVERTDGKPLQAMIVHTPDTTTGKQSRTVVFRRPVPRLLLTRRRHNGRDAWEVAVAPAECCDPAFVAAFINVIGAFGANRTPHQPCVHRSK